MMSSLIKIRSLAWITFLSGIRRNAVTGLVFLTLAAELSGLFFFQFIHRDIGRAVSDFVISIGWAAGLIFVFFHAVQTVSWNETRGTLFFILSRPFSRNEYVAGVFSGLMLLLVVFNLIAAAMGWGVILWLKQTVPSAYFSGFSHGAYLLSWAGILAMEAMLVAVVILASSLIRGAFSVLLVTVSYYFICSGLPVVREAVAQWPAGEDTATPLILKGLTVFFPSFEGLDFKDFTVHADGLTAFTDIVLQFSLSSAYTLIVLILAAFIYSRRDLQ